MVWKHKSSKERESKKKVTKNIEERRRKGDSGGRGREVEKKPKSSKKWHSIRVSLLRNKNKKKRLQDIALSWSGEDKTFTLEESVLKVFKKLLNKSSGVIRPEIT